MKSMFLFVFVLIACGLNAVCGTVQWNTVSYIPNVVSATDPNVNSMILASANYAGDDISTVVYLNTAINETLGYTILEASTSTYLAAWGSPWREYAKGEIVRYGTIFGDYNDYFFISDSEGARSYRNLRIDIGQTVYLGFASIGYGWVQLGFDGTSVYVINSAVDIDGDPIQVGLIPEPAALRKSRDCPSAPTRSWPRPASTLTIPTGSGSSRV